MMRVALQPTFPLSIGILRVTTYLFDGLSSVDAHCLVPSLRFISPLSLSIPLCVAASIVFMVLRFLYAMGVCCVGRLCSLSPRCCLSSLFGSLLESVLGWSGYYPPVIVTLSITLMVLFVTTMTSTTIAITTIATAITTTMTSFATTKQ